MTLKGVCAPREARAKFVSSPVLFRLLFASPPLLFFVFLYVSTPFRFDFFIPTSSCVVLFMSRPLSRPLLLFIVRFVAPLLFCIAPFFRRDPFWPTPSFVACPFL